MLLEGFGLVSQTAADGDAGLALFRENPSHFDVVMLDLVMPGLNGEQVLERLRVLRPDVRVLLVSGYTEANRSGDSAPNAGGWPSSRNPYPAKRSPTSSANSLG